ncbi:MAG: M16 family metallopeptidase [Desulfonatronovibrionaceae bacterium]
MFCRLSITLGIFCMFITAALSAPGQLEATDLVILENGLQILVEEDERFPLTSMRLYVHAGSAYESPDQAGISHLLEHMVFKGSEKRGPGETAEEVESAGGDINAATSLDYTMYKVDLPADKWQLGLDVLRDMAFGSVFDPRELKSEKDVVIAELERGEDNPGQRLFKSIQKSVWGGTPYSRPVIGYPQTVKDITSQDLKDYVARLYQPQSMLLVVCGQVSTEEVVDRAKVYFGDLENDHPVLPAQPLDSAQTQTKPRMDITTGPWKKAYAGIAFPIPALSAPETADLEVLSYLLGGDMTSYLHRKYKYEKQLVDSISCSAVSMERGGMLYIRAVLPPDSMDVFWDELTSDLAGLSADSFTPEMIERARANIEDELFSSKETLGGTASKLGYFQFFEHSVRAEDKYIYDLGQVDQDSLQQVMDSYLHPDRLNMSLLLPDSVPVDRDAFQEVLAGNWEAKEEQKTGVEKRAEKTGREVLELGQGQSLVLIEDPSLPYTALNISWPGGDELLEGGESGLAELTARSLVRGTGNRTATEIQDFLSDRAAELDSGSGRQSFSVQAKFPVRYSRDIYGLVREVLFSPEFSPEEVSKAVKEQIAEIRSRDDRPAGYMFRRLFPFLFSEGPFAEFHLGDPSGLEEMDPDELRSFWDKQFSRPCVITLCGQIDRDALEPLVRDLRKREVKSGEKPPKNVWSPLRETELSLEDRHQAHVLLAFPVPGLNDDSTPVLKVLKTVLAGQGGVLFRELRDRKGLGYTVTPLLWQTPEYGFLAFYIGTYPEKEEQAVQGFRQVIEDLRSKAPQEKQVKRAVNMITGEYYRSHQSLSSRSSEAASLLTMGLNLDFNREMIDRVGEVKPEDVRRAARKYLQMDSSYFMVLRPGDEEGKGKDPTP